MEGAFEQLREAICRPGARAEMPPAELTRVASQTIVALPAGGLSSRMSAMTDPAGVHKSVLPLPSGDTMLGRTVRMYRDAGFGDFLALVSFRAQSIESYLGNGSTFGVNVTYSYDPVSPVGRGGAIRHALDTGAIPQSKHLIVHNPDDVIVNYPGNFPGDLVATHRSVIAQGVKATAVMTDGLPATYTGMLVRNGVVEEVMQYPKLPVPAHVGVTMFSPDVYPLFEELFDLKQKMDFEAVLFPRLVEERSLYTMFMPSECWLQVNDPRGWDAMIKRLSAAS